MIQLCSDAHNLDKLGRVGIPNDESALLGVKSAVFRPFLGYPPLLSKAPKTVKSNVFDWQVSPFPPKIVYPGVFVFFDDFWGF